MPKSLVPALLPKMSRDELVDLANSLGLASTGSKHAIADRIAERRRSFRKLISSSGPWLLSGWNDIVENRLRGVRHRSFADVRDEAALILVVGSREKRVGEVLRDPDTLESLADYFETTPEAVREGLNRFNGNTLVRNIWSRLRPNRKAASHRIDTPESTPAILIPVSSSRSRTRTTPLRGERVGRWLIGEHIGDGGFGRVFAASDSKRAMPDVVLKFPLDPEKEASIVREAQKAICLQHPSICKYYSIDCDDRFGHFLVMQHCGDPVRTLCPKAGMEVETALSVVYQAATALDYLHSVDIVHGDVNPGNILVSRNGDVRITDFGISANLVPIASTRGRQTRIATAIHGRHDIFSAVEVLNGQAPRRSSDQYSLALVFCAMLTGMDKFFNSTRSRFQRLTTRQNRAIRKALDHDPRMRFPTCARLVEELYADR